MEKLQCKACGSYSMVPMDVVVDQDESNLIGDEQESRFTRDLLPSSFTLVASNRRRRMATIALSEVPKNSFERSQIGPMPSCSA